MRLQSWFPFTVHVCLNGREWLARQMDAAGLRYQRRENCFAWIEDLPAAQRLLEAQLHTDWPPLLNGLTAAANPAHARVFADCPLVYYWSADQSEWASDVLFKDPRRLDALYPQWLAHGMQRLGSRAVMRFLQRRLFQGPKRGFEVEVVTDLVERPEGVRIKHRVNGNYIKMYNKQQSVLRVETVVNQAREFRVYRPKEGDPEGSKQWRYLRKGVADLHRRAEVSQRANERYLDALATGGGVRPTWNAESTALPSGARPGVLAPGPQSPGRSGRRVARGHSPRRVPAHRLPQP